MGDRLLKVSFRLGGQDLVRFPDPPYGVGRENEPQSARVCNLGRRAFASSIC